MDRPISYLCLLLLLAGTIGIGHATSANSAQLTGDEQLVSSHRSSIRNARSLGDVMEKVKNKIFGSRKQSNGASSANANSANTIQQANGAQMSSQYNPYAASLAGYNWPAGAGSPGNLLYKSPYNTASMMSLGSQYSPLGSLDSSSLSSSLSSMGGMGSINGINSGMGGMSPGASPQGNAGSQSNGLLSSASQLISQYLSPSAGSSSSASSSLPSSNSNGAFNSPYNSPAQQQSMGQQQQSQGSQIGQSGAGPAGSSSIPASYTDFSQMIDSLVAASGVGQRQPASIQQFLSATSHQSNGQPNGGPNGPSMGPGDNEMSSSNMMPTYMSSGQGASAMSGPIGHQQQQQQQQAAPQQQASQLQSVASGPKNPMVSLAEQLSPGSQYNKLISFPFSLGPSDDKDGRLRLHIPYMKQHIKRMSTIDTPPSGTASSNAIQSSSSPLAQSSTSVQQAGQQPSVSVSAPSASVSSSAVGSAAISAMSNSKTIV